MQDRRGNTDSTLRGLLSRLFGRSSVPAVDPGSRPVPGVWGGMPAAPTDSQALAQAQAIESGPMTDANLPPSILRPRRGPPPQSPAAFIAPAGTLGGAPITEGQNANIGDDSRQRALDMVAALRHGGAL